MSKFRFSIRSLFVVVGITAAISLCASHFIATRDGTIVGDWVYPSTIDNGVLGTTQRLRISDNGHFELLVTYRDGWNHFFGKYESEDEDTCKITVSDFKSSLDWEMEDFNRSARGSKSARLRYRVMDGILWFDVSPRQPIDFHGFPIRLQRYSRSIEPKEAFLDAVNGSSERGEQ
jgi:hypothetical protein